MSSLFAFLSAKLLTEVNMYQTSQCPFFGSFNLVAMKNKIDVGAFISSRSLISWVRLCYNCLTIVSVELTKTETLQG